MKFILWGLIIGGIYWYMKQFKTKQTPPPKRSDLQPKASPYYTYLRVPIYMPIDFMTSQYIKPLNSALSHGDLGKVTDAQSFQKDNIYSLIEIKMSLPEEALQVVRAVLSGINNPDNSTLHITTKELKRIISPV